MDRIINSILREITVLVTGGGSPGIIGTIHSLKNNYDNRKVKIICTDAKSECAGKFIADKFYQIPRADHNKMEYLKVMYDICKFEKVDVVLPQNTSELILLSNNEENFLRFNTKIIITGQKTISLANNKYELLKVCKKNNIPYPDYNIASNKKKLVELIKKMGWPKKTIVVKVPDSNGSRGIRIIDEGKDYKKMFYNEKPTNLFMKLNNFLDLLDNEFPPLLIMEYLPGDEVSIDVFRDKKNFISIPRKRNQIRSGISFENSAVNDEELIRYSKVLSDELNLKYCFGFQFKYDSSNIPKILECNPRVQGTMVFSTFMGVNLIYSSIKSCLGEKIPELKYEWDTKLLRYWGAIGINSNSITKV